MIKLFIKSLLYRLRGWCPPTEVLVRNGMKVGKNFKRLNDVILDPGHCWLIEIGDNVTMAPRVHVLCHDASTKIWLGHAKIGMVTIGNNVFIGANTVILPGSKIGDNVIIGAQSLVSGDVPANSVVAGCPAKVISSLPDYLEKMRKCMEKGPVYGETYTVRGGINLTRKEEMKEMLFKNKIGFVD